MLRYNDSHARYDDNLLAEQFLEHDQTRVERAWQRREVQPDIKSSLWRHMNREAHLVQTFKDVIPLVAEMFLQRKTILTRPFDVEHLDGGALHWVACTTVQVAACLVERSDQVLGPNDPADAPSRASTQP